MIWFILYFFILSLITSSALSWASYALNKSEKERGRLAATVYEQDEQIRLLSEALIEKEEGYEFSER